MRDVLLVCMPFGPVFRPAIGLSLLRAGLARHDISCGVRYFTIDFAERIGQQFYCDLAYDEGGPPPQYLAGEWVFAAALNGGPADDDPYVDEILLNRHGAQGKDKARSPAFVRRILNARRKVPAFLDDCLERVLCEEPKVVGFTSVFQQHVASLALARALKRARPEMRVVFGGANCEGVMGGETLRQFAFIDAVVSGEGDVVFPELARRALAAAPLAGLPGVRTRETLEEEFRAGRFPNAPMVACLDDLPYPDHDDFFEQFNASRYGREWQPTVPFETSRGCWWGQRSHCTFCGLNGGSLHFRSKSATRALDEFDALVSRYPGSDLRAVDNILDMRHFAGFIPALAGRHTDGRIFYETKSNLRKRHVRMLSAAGVRDLQPGIESLSDAVLRLMRKGVTGIQNIQLLKWCKELGVTASWNVLWGFPGEPPGDYERMAALVPLLTHLQPPTSWASFRLDRFSPIFSEPEQAGIEEIQPAASYRYVYALEPQAVTNMACYFTFRYREPQDVAAYVGALRAEIRRWRKAAKRSDLFFVDVNGRLAIWDLRPAFERPITVLDGIDRELYLSCDEICDLHRAVEVTRKAEASRREEDVRGRLDSFVARGLAVKSGTRYLALAVPLGDYSPAPEIIDEVYRIARLLGERRTGAWVIPLDRIADRPWRIRTLRRAPTRASARPRRRRPERLTPDRFSITDLGELAIR